MPDNQRVRVFAPAGIGNFGPGLDILGCAVTGAGDTVDVVRAATPGVRIARSGHPSLSTAPDRHAAGLAAIEVLRRADAVDIGLEISVAKGVPIAGGQGGSAASAVASAVAANRLLGEPLDRHGVFEAALASEERLAGRHADNVVTSLFGGIILLRGEEPLDIVSLPVPDALRIVIVAPDQRLTTAEARAVLPKTIDRATAMRQAAQVAAVVAALATDDLALLGRAMEDFVAEPARAPLLRGYVEARDAARMAGALGCGISGAGPASFAIVDDEAVGERVRDAMVAAYARMAVAATGRVARVSVLGARVVDATGELGGDA